MIDLNKLAGDMLAVAKKRGENGANLKTDTVSMLKHTATEVVEAMDAYSKHHTGQLIHPALGKERFEAFAFELADIIACALIICANEGIDMEVALMMCHKKNEARAEGKGDKK